MDQVVLHPFVKRQVSAIIAAPPHALILAGPTGSGKARLAQQIAQQLLGVADFQKYAYGLTIAPEGASIGIDAVRTLERFTSRKVPGDKSVARVIILEDSHTLTIEAQNALLKLLEEPPADTVLLLTTASNQALLPTVRSRAQILQVQSPERVALETHFTGRGFDSSTIAKAYAVSGGLPGLMDALLTNAEHPLLAATEQARAIVSKPAYKRLLLIDPLTKQRDLLRDTLFILQQMAHAALQTAEGSQALRWRRVLTASYHASEATAVSAQPKLVLIDAFLSF